MGAETRTGRRLASVLLVLLVAGPAAPAGGQTPVAPAATPVAVATDGLLDLPAMTLSPSDLAALGLPGFGLANLSSMRDAETDALVQSDGDALETAERLAAYRDHGFRRRYVGSLLQPRVPLVRRRAGLIDADVRISTAIAQFETAEGAAAVFDLNEGPLDDVPGGDVPGSRQFGERSELTRSTGAETLSGEPLQRLELAFQTGTLIGEVTIVDYRNVEPDVATVEMLADALVGKIARAAGDAPGLGSRALRLTPSDAWIADARLRDFYVRSGGTREPTFAEIVAALRDGRATPGPGAPPRPGTMPPIDTYMYWTPIGIGDPLALPLYVAWLDRYASPEQAAAALASLSDDLGPGYVEVEEFAANETIADGSREWVYAYEGDPSGPVRGRLVVVRVGDHLIRAQVDGPDDVLGSGVRALAAAQAACLAEAAICPPRPMLDVLAEVRPPAR